MKGKKKWLTAVIAGAATVLAVAVPELAAVAALLADALQAVV